jgi:GT2 family glycosyltransferase
MITSKSFKVPKVIIGPVRRLVDHWGALLRRSGEVLLEEGPEGFLARMRRRLSSDDRKIFDRYRAWVAREETTRPPRVASPPLVSIVTPVKDPPLWVLRKTAASVLGQRDARVEWCVADDASRPEVRAELEALARREPRVRVTLLDATRGIAGATNAALGLARGELVAFLDHDDELHEDAIAWMQEPFRRDPGTGAAYSDEDKLDPSGERHAPFLKPGFSPDLLLSCNYVSHLFVARHDLVREVGGLRPETDGSQDYDLALRLSERAKVAHVPRVLYHWRMLRGSVAANARAKTWAYAAARLALTWALERRGESASVEDGPWLGSYRILRSETPSFTVVRGSPHPDPPPLRGGGGEVLVFLDDALVPEPGALEELARHAVRRGVALVAPRVLSWDRRIESAGLVLGFGRHRIAACPFRGRSADDACYFGLARATRDVSAVSSAAFAIERSKLEALGGLSRAVEPAHVGVELALRARGAGLRTIYASDATIVRRSTRTPGEGKGAAAARRLLAAALGRDEHISPHFLRGKERLELPSRRARLTSG